MRRTNIILLLVLICIGGIAFFLICRYTYESKQIEIKQKAKEVFIESFSQELKNRNQEGSFSFKYNVRNFMVSNIPDSVYFEDEQGKHWYRLNPKKHHMNITDDANIRSLHSLIFKKYPINPDSLNMIWGGNLGKYNVYGKSALCISVMGNDGGIKSKSTSGSEWCSLSKLVFTVYVGYACEIEIIGYLNYSLWGIMYSDILLYLFLYSACVFVAYKLCLVLIRKVNSISKREIIEIPVIEIVQEVSNTPVRSYMLHDNVIFYAEQRKIEKIGGVQNKLQPQTCQLLELFLKAKDDEYILTDKHIMEKLWLNRAGTADRLHKAIGRLRSCIQEVEPTIDIKRNTSSSYQLLL
ncbi:helix-turn-helix domain-containing protein [Bacteroides sp.]|uniref:helix-turn-helix domain-containing protein n=1 Tax=Bacteroides sp. TaxID=29523 RepID=UPI002618395F|nr:helix-turn-helix domain-containing protein [Bacteroides sp.]MDD3037210.1 helix-turn-helix domain-containing protein [Bacteroides sp.]